MVRAPHLLQPWSLKARCPTCIQLCDVLKHSVHLVLLRTEDVYFI
jgi:hypothetical protein